MPKTTYESTIQAVKGRSYGNRTFVDDLIPLVYKQLRGIATRQLSSDRQKYSLSPSTLVHEAYIKLIGNSDITWKNRAHFLSIAAITMRRILVDHARKRLAKKRGGGGFSITFNEETHSQTVGLQSLMKLEEALNDLEILNSRQAHVIEYWFFGGMKQKEIAEVLRVSLPTVRRDWRISRAWLASRIRSM